MVQWHIYKIGSELFYIVKQDTPQGWMTLINMQGTILYKWFFLEHQFVQDGNGITAIKAKVKPNQPQFLEIYPDNKMVIDDDNDQDHDDDENNKNGTNNTNAKNSSNSPVNVFATTVTEVKTVHDALWATSHTTTTTTTPFILPVENKANKKSRFSRFSKKPGQERSWKKFGFKDEDIV